MPDRGADQEPELVFFRDRPERLGERAPLASSLQNLDTCFMLIALGRYPPALISCASAIESAMKAALNLPDTDRISHTRLLQRAIQHYPALSLHGGTNKPFDEEEVKTFRKTRDRVAHFGFSSQDDDLCAGLLLRTGFRFLDTCYTQFFQFPLAQALELTLYKHLTIAEEVFDEIQGMKVDNRPSAYGDRYCFDTVGLVVRRYIQPMFMCGWEMNYLVEGGEQLLNFEIIREQKRVVTSYLDPSWDFDCPICGSGDAFICRIDFEPAYAPTTVRLGAGICVECGLRIHTQVALLTNRLCQEQLRIKRERILMEYGFGPKPSGPPRASDSQVTVGTALTVGVSVPSV